MSTTRCEHGEVISDTMGDYRCFKCEPIGAEDIADLELLKNMTACDECGIVFKDRNAYGEHVCHGKQGR